MANYFYVFPAENAHIDFLIKHPNAIDDYFDGKKPEVELPDKLPESWPKTVPKRIGFEEANHRNTDLYHWILNAGPEKVVGAGSLFQTWSGPKHSAIDLTGDGEIFAFKSDQISELTALIKKIDVLSVQKAFTAWCKDYNKNYEPDIAACEPIYQEFKEFDNGLEAVMAKGMGLIWAPG